MAWIEKYAFYMEGLTISKISCNFKYFENAGPPMQNLRAFRDIAEWNLKVSLRMGSESVIGVSNSSDVAWLGLKSKHFR